MVQTLPLIGSSGGNLGGGGPIMSIELLNSKARAQSIQQRPALSTQSTSQLKGTPWQGFLDPELPDVFTCSCHLYFIHRRKEDGPDCDFSGSLFNSTCQQKSILPYSFCYHVIIYLFQGVWVICLHFKWMIHFTCLEINWREVHTDCGSTGNSYHASSWLTCWPVCSVHQRYKIQVGFIFCWA